MKTIKNTANLPEIRCPECGKLLAKGLVFIYSTKCPRCKKYLTVRTVSSKLASFEDHLEKTHDESR